jgi:hypothetical protein
MFFCSQFTVVLHSLVIHINEGSIVPCILLERLYKTTRYNKLSPTKIRFWYPLNSNQECWNANHHIFCACVCVCVWCVCVVCLCVWCVCVWCVCGVCVVCVVCVCVWCVCGVCVYVCMSHSILGTFTKWRKPTISIVMCVRMEHHSFCWTGLNGICC